MSQKHLFCVLMVLVAMTACFFSPFTSTAFGAGGLPVQDWDYSNFGGSFYPSDSTLPYCSSSSGSNNDYIWGNFSLKLDPNVSSIDSGYWDFHTSSYDPSSWTATCNLRGKRDSGEDWPQYRNWSQSISKEDGFYLSADLDMDCYEYPSDQDINNLMSQIRDLHIWLSDNPDSEGAEIVRVQLQSLHAHLELLQLMPREQDLQIYGHFNLSPSELEGSYFNYSEYQEISSYWDSEFGPDGGWVNVIVPAWRAEFTVRGRFLADTPELAMAMGMPFVQSVPEPSTVVLLITALASAGFGILRKLWV